MSDTLPIDGKDYISSKRAAELSGYTQDYIGQLARGSQIDAKRVSGLWYVFMPSLESYKATAEAYTPEPPQRKQQSDPESLISFEGKDYVSASRAAKLTGYHQDYVGQLARSGAILSRQVGNRWYVEREGISAHKREKDALLAAVQAQSVGLVRPDNKVVSGADTSQSEPFYTYTSESAELFPLSEKETLMPTELPKLEIRSAQSSAKAPIDLRGKRGEILDHMKHAERVKLTHRTPVNTISYAIVTSVLIGAIILAGGIGYFVLGGGRFPDATPSNDTAYASSSGTTHQSVWSAFSQLGSALESVVTPELNYQRSQ